MENDDDLRRYVCQELESSVVSPLLPENIPPTLEDLNNIYGTFCDICSFSDLLETLLGVDAQFCGLCDVIDEIPTEINGQTGPCR